MGKLRDAVGKYAEILATEDNSARVKTHLYAFNREVSYEYGEAVMNVYQHNGADFHVTGTPYSIDVLKETLIPNPVVKGLAIYHRTPGGEMEKVEQLGYYALKAKRGAVSA